MRLDFSIQVYGQSPKIDVLNGIDLFNGAVPGTAPTHNQLIEFWTPPIYRTPGLPISALAFWAAQHFWEKSKKSRCEEEIAELPGAGHAGRERLGPALYSVATSSQ